MTANGAFAKTFFLFLIVVAAGTFGWSQAPDPTTTISNGVVTQNVNFPAWTWIALFVGFGLAMVCIFKPKASPFLAPLYALAEGVFLGVISKAFESQWDGIVFQAILATIAVFFATLALYVFGVVKVTRKFQMVGHRRHLRASSCSTSARSCCRCSAPTSRSGTSRARWASRSA